MLAGMWESGLAAGGGADEEAITFDVEPGNYGVLCFVPAPDGTPHAFMGMQKEFTVS
jgi:plastocyanin